MQFEDVGVFLSFISYPFHEDGKDLYNHVLEPFFKGHKEQITSFDADADDYCSNLYQPAGYRMFGSNGLTVLSLVDDYSFYNRFFNKNHIQSVLHDIKQKEFGLDESLNDEEIELDFKSVVISGITELDEEDRSLSDVALDTFLQPDVDKRYRYIGIIRLKIDHRLLIGEGHAMTTVRKIKKEIGRLFDDNGCVSSDYFTIECYDNDELTVVAFSERLLTLYNFLGNVRSIKATDINLSFSQESKDSHHETHVFGLTYLCFGYDLQRGLGDDIQATDKIYCEVETKPGHRDVFHDYLCLLAKTSSESTPEVHISNINVNISGGCKISFTIPLQEIVWLEDKCKNLSSEFCRDIRNIKVSLQDCLDAKTRVLRGISDSHIIGRKEKGNIISGKEIADIKRRMKQVGVSKLVRERMLALLEFYNHSCQDMLQRFYLNELKPALTNFDKVISELKEKSNEDLNSIENVLNEEITNLENACYDRLHIQKGNQPPLEYSGGIQQHLTSFDYVYKQIYRVFSPEDKDSFYLTISGAERASSERSLFKLNIHDIIFPELFVTTVWKEIANFALKSLQNNNPENVQTKEQLDTLNTWSDFTLNKDSFGIIRDRIFHSENLLHDDNVSKIIKELVSPELIEYFIKDYVVYHFAFCRDYTLLWHFYFKILLQTTNCYVSLNHIDKKFLVYMLLRVFMVAELESDGEENHALIEFLRQMADKPYDYSLNGPWVECYSKSFAAAKTIYAVLDNYGFRKMVDYTIASYEGNIYSKEKPSQLFNILDIQKILDERQKTIKEMQIRFRQGTLIQECNNDVSNNELTFIICLFAAFLKTVFTLDYGEGMDFIDSPVKSVPRDCEGRVIKDALLNFANTEENRKKMIHILVDTTGGFFIPSAEYRQIYFKLRTTLYKSLWNYRFVNEKFFDHI